MIPGKLVGVVLATTALTINPTNTLVPEPGTGSSLLGTYCTSSASCWAVGTYGLNATTGANEVLHWNGTRWLKVPAPSAAGADSSLQAVRCSRAADCWAVGTLQAKSGAILGQALHWNGRKWTRASVPEPGATSGLDDVACTSPASCWAVGTIQTSPITYLNEALHWNGRKWALVGTPDPGGTAPGDLNLLSSVRCPSAATCIAVGYAGTRSIIVNQVLRWNGSTWSTLSVPNPGGTDTSGDRSQLHGLACSSATNCWAVGSYEVSGTPVSGLNQVLHWNGSAWSQVDVPEPGGTTGGAGQELLFAACGSATNCWAVGDSGPGNIDGKFVVTNQALHWDGGTWSVVATPNPAGHKVGDINRLSAVRCVTARNCWVVGTASTGSVGDGQVLHWDGGKWSVR